MTPRYRQRPGVILFLTLVILILIAGIGYMLTSRVSSQVRRNQYIVDYQCARYGCDSAYKYAQTMMNGITYKLVDRPNDPDFSDLFAFNEEQYRQLLEDYAYKKMLERRQSGMYGNSDDSNSPDTRRNFYNNSTDPNMRNRTSSDLYDANGMPDSNGVLFDPNQGAKDANDPNNIVIPGPYGPAWPLVSEPVEFSVGSATIKIEIEDENAKFPLVWATIDDKDKMRQAQAATDTFFEWIYTVSQGTLDHEKITNIKSQLADLNKVVSLGLDAFKQTTDANSKTAEPNSNQQADNSRVSQLRRSSQGRKQQQAQTPAQRTPAQQAGDFARLVSSSLVDTEPLEVPYLKSERRTESGMKYISRWGSPVVNVNSAPRLVLEALFSWGGDPQATADAVIKERQITPFKDFADLQKRLFKYSDNFTRCKDLIATQSRCFTIKITASQGLATVRLTAAVLKDGSNTQTIGVVSE